MLAALQTAQKRLGKVPQPRLAPVLRALQHDIERLQSTSLTDIPGLLIRLDELVALVETLPLQNAVGPQARSAQAPERGRMDLRTYGIGAQILRDCGVHKMRLMGNPRRMPSMAGYGLEITGYLAKE
jgi:GTP cyclohydrolase II